MRRIAAHQRQEHRRRGAAVVQFALLAPIYLTLVIGTLELSQALEASNVMSAALREGGRLAAMDWNGVVPEGATVNQKVIADIRNFLIAAGVPGEQMDLSITSAAGLDEGQPFDLSDPDNQRRLFRITAEIPYEIVSQVPLSFMNGRKLTQSLVFRAGKITLVN